VRREGQAWALALVADAGDSQTPAIQSTPDREARDRAWSHVE
jgi:hypothetical protein